MITIRWVFVSVILLTEAIVLVLLLFFKNNPVQHLIKDRSRIGELTQIPFSFARSQLVWWTLIIVGCLAVSYGINGELNGITDPGLLVLLGISTSTVAGGSMIDNRDIMKTAKSGNPDSSSRHQDEISEGFFSDILSDNNGISIHRFQAFLFNLLYGIIFILSFIDSSCSSFIHFDEFTLGLLGISSAGYITLKAQEN
jgi:hypothetical protein